MGKCDSRREINAFWKKLSVYELHKQRQVLEDSFSDLQGKEALLKKKKDVSALQKKTEALLKESADIIF